jgi:hypothetical protein
VLNIKSLRRLANGSLILGAIVQCTRSLLRNKKKAKKQTIVIGCALVCVTRYGLPCTAAAVKTTQLLVALLLPPRFQAFLCVVHRKGGGRSRKETNSIRATALSPSLFTFLYIYNVIHEQRCKARGLHGNTP